MDAYVWDPIAQQGSVLTELSNGTPTASWVLFSVQLPLSLAGRSWEFGFVAQTDGDLNTNFFIDSVSLTAAACPATAGGSL